MRVIDFHTHAFPDELAEQTVPKLSARAKITAALDGKVSSLLNEMDRLDIEAAVVLTIATKADQFDSILEWCKQGPPYAKVTHIEAEWEEFAGEFNRFEITY